MNKFALCLVSLTLSGAAFAQKKVLDHSVYDTWNTLRNTNISNDGRWIMWTVAPQDGDATAFVQANAGGTTYTIPRGSNLKFTNDSGFVIAQVDPPKADVKKAKKDKAKPEDMPKGGLIILNLANGTKTEIARVQSYSLPEEDSGWFVYKPEPPKPATTPRGAGRREEAKPETPAAEPAKPETTPAAPAKDTKPTKKADHKPGDVIVVRQLSTGKEERLENVVLHRFDKAGKLLALTLSTKDGKGDGIALIDLPSGKRTNVVEAMGRYPRLVLTEDGQRIAFLTDKDDYAAKKPSHSLYVYSRNDREPRLLAKESTDGIPKGNWIAGEGTLSFSKKGSRVLFGTQPKPEEEKKDETPDDEKVTVDIWSWVDDRMMPQQLLLANMERQRSYLAVAHLDTGKVVQLATPEMPSVSIAQQGEGDVALGSSDLPYRQLVSWDTGYMDYYLVDVRNGTAKRIIEKTDGNARLSPTGRYVAGYDPQTKTHFSIDPKTLRRTNLSEAIPFPTYDEQVDVPSPPDAYGTAGWTKDDERLLIYDRFDIWAVDPDGQAKPVNVTDGVGRRLNIRFRYIETDPEAEFVRSDKPMLLSAFHETTKQGGFYRDSLNRRDLPQRIVMEDKSFTGFAKAKGSDAVVYRRGDFVEYPDLWVSNMAFENSRKVSDANPQQKDYNWGKAELISWTSSDGQTLQGLLIKPEDFTPSKKYPMITYFYERDSDNLHVHRTPAPSASTINLPYFASNGYVIFIPDIPYKEGYPGESAVSAILPGVQAVLSRGFVDPKRLGIQGQSWGGYQVAYLVTETNMFAAACAGAPVSNMFSAYGGIRYGSGMVRQMQYERGQSRIGASPWEKPLRYLENSPIFFADKVRTPLLMMSNDKDGAVPWTQGIEYFAALRRLGRPAWLVNYNNEDHNLVQRHNRKDWSIRMQQFFDHYLKGAPMPVWMAKGVPATQKGRTMGFEPAETKPTGTKAGN